MNVNRYTIARDDGWRDVKISIDGELCWWSDVKSEIDRLTRELAERDKQLASIRQLSEDAEARAVRGQAFSLLMDLVEALDSAFISSWQSTAAWQSQLDAAREWLSARPALPTKGESKNVD